ncbi:MAG: hypothetical protein JKY65_25840 [Planctomycetes bacterium]|nr:hypothetical protein [Planctomycetota bacterium]
MRSLTSLALVFALAATAGAQEISDERPLLLSELAALLRQGVDPAALKLLGTKVAGAISAAPANGASPVILSAADKAKLGAIVQGALAGDPAALEQLNTFPGWNIPDVGKGLRGELSQLPPGTATRPTPTRVSETLGIPVADQSKPKNVLEPLGHGVYRGDIYDPKKLERYPDSNRLAELLNRLSLNGTGWVTHQGTTVRSAAGLLDLLRKQEHTVEAFDRRSIANFSGLYFKAPGETKYREVVAPVWLDTLRPVPGKSHTLLVPATHSEMVFAIRGPLVNADVAFYLGIDHQATFRPTAWLRPSWTGSKTLRSFKGKDAISAASAASWVRRNLTRLTADRRLMELRSKAYGQLGVCNDATALIEGRMGLKATHWPLIRLPELYRNAGRLTSVSDSLPYDTDPAVVPSLKRVIHPLPFVPGKFPDYFPDLASDIDALVAEAKARGVNLGIVGATKK